MSETIHLTVQDLTESATLDTEQVRVIEAVSPEMTVERVDGGVKISTKDWKQETEAVVHDGAKGDKGDAGDPGNDGVSPTASVTQTDTGATVTVTDASGTTTANLTNGQDGQPGRDGQDGAPGQDGVSPTITVTDIPGGHRVTITDATGAHSFDVMDGEDGGWAVQDVQVNGVSVLTDGVANVPLASNTVYGVVKANASYGVQSGNDGILRIGSASSNQCRQQTGSTGYQNITVNNQHAATFYGLVAASGDTTQKSSSNAVGQYTEAAKSAISTMLSGSVSVSGTTPTINALPGIRYVCGEVSTLDITLPASGIVDVVFTSGSTPTVLTVTAPTGKTLSWIGDFDPTALEADTVYEINVAVVSDKCLGVAGAWT